MTTQTLYEYDPSRGIEDQAADAIHHAVAMYKAAGYTREQFRLTSSAFWVLFGVATPTENKQ